MAPRRYMDSDSERLPDGMERVGYDADDEVYIYQAADGSRWQGAPGQRYGTVYRISGPSQPSRPPRPSRPPQPSQSSRPSLPPPPYSRFNEAPAGHSSQKTPVKSFDNWSWLDVKTGSGEARPEADERRRGIDEWIQGKKYWLAKRISSVCGKLGLPLAPKAQDDGKRINTDRAELEALVDQQLEGLGPIGAELAERRRQARDQQSQGEGRARHEQLVEDTPSWVASSEPRSRRGATITGPSRDHSDMADYSRGSAIGSGSRHERNVASAPGRRRTTRS